MTPPGSAARFPLGVPRLYAIADTTSLAERSLPDAVEAMAQAGIRWIQLRAKNTGDREILALVEACVRRLAGSGVDLWVNDRADIATLIGVPGLHLGQRDLPAVAARRVVGEEMWIGSSTHDLEQLEIAQSDRAIDLVAVGPVFTTASKERPDPVVGVELVRRARALVSKPLVAIGGIDASNAAQVLAAGADAIAVIGALAKGESIERDARRLLNAIS